MGCLFQLTESVLMPRRVPEAIPGSMMAKFGIRKSLRKGLVVWAVVGDD